MKDFTISQARRWIVQETAKHNTLDSIRQRLASEQKLLRLTIYDAQFPNSLWAHRQLIEILTNKLA